MTVPAKFISSATTVKLAAVRALAVCTDKVPSVFKAPLPASSWVENGIEVPFATWMLPFWVIAVIAPVPGV